MALGRPDPGNVWYTDQWSGSEGGYYQSWDMVPGPYQSHPEDFPGRGSELVQMSTSRWDTGFFDDPSNLTSLAFSAAAGAVGGLALVEAAPVFEDLFEGFDFGDLGIDTPPDVPVEDIATTIEEVPSMDDWGFPEDTGDITIDDGWGGNSGSLGNLPVQQAMSLGRGLLGGSAAGAGAYALGRSAGIMVNGVRMQVAKLWPMVKQFGPEVVAAAVGMSVGQLAQIMFAHPQRRRRRRGISSRDVRTTKRVVRFVRNLSSDLRSTWGGGGGGTRTRRGRGGRNIELIQQR